MKLVKRLAAIGSTLVFERDGFLGLSFLLIIVEFFLGLHIIFNVSYTEIDFVAYMQQVETFINGTLDYDKLIGQTGPCVYPAGHVYVYTLLYFLSDRGSNIPRIQFFFLFIYLLTLVLIFNIYRLCEKIPPYILLFMCLTSYRVHSIYLLRLFNDPLAMLFFYAAINSSIYSHMTLSAIFFSLAVSIKMNVLLAAPGFLLVLLRICGFYETLGHLAECGIIQLLLGSIFLFRNTMAYLGSAFEFSRQFMYQWTVNWKVIPEPIFLDRRFHAFLLAMHLLFLTLFIVYFIRSRGGLSRFLHLLPPQKGRVIPADDTIYPMLVSNFIGIAFSRSLHYQFYVWYYHAIPYLLWSVRYSVPVRFLLYGLIELSWNTYPSTFCSSALLHVCHLIILIGLFYELIMSSSKFCAPQKSIISKKLKNA